MGTNGMAGHYFSASQWSLPTWEAYQTLAAYAQAHGAPRERPYLVHPTAWPDGGLRASYDHLRAEYEASRPPFTSPMGVSNVWATPTVSGAERLKAASGETLHPCQKPLLFAERMIRASSRPGDTVWVPFGGTLRELVAAERIARADPGEARRVVTCEINQDGRDYIGAALEQVEGRAGVDRRQVSLFGGAG
jgi:site-specific DNA-methyltransferase (adenine-specific)